LKAPAVVSILPPNEAVLRLAPGHLRGHGHGHGHGGGRV